MAELDPPVLALHRSRAPDGATVLVLVGELDIATAPQVRAAVEEARSSGSAGIVFDAAQLTFMDSSGLAALLSAVNSGLSVTVSHPTPAVRRVIEISGLTVVLPMKP